MIGHALKSTSKTHVIIDLNTSLCLKAMHFYFCEYFWFQQNHLCSKSSVTYSKIYLSDLLVGCITIAHFKIASLNSKIAPLISMSRGLFCNPGEAILLGGYFAAQNFTVQTVFAKKFCCKESEDLRHFRFFSGRLHPWY